MQTRTLLLAAALALGSATALAEGAAGKWNASIETPQGPFPLTFEFAVDGTALTGTIGNEFMGVQPISEGTVDGSALAFKFVMQGPNGSMTINYTGTVNGNELALVSTIADAPPGAPAETRFTATRAP